MYSWSNGFYTANEFKVSVVYPSIFKIDQILSNKTLSNYSNKTLKWIGWGDKVAKVFKSNVGAYWGIQA